MRNLYFLIPYVIFAAIFSILQLESEANIKKHKFTKHERIEGAIKDNLFTSSDVETGKIPFNKLFNAIQEGQRRADVSARNRSGGETLADAKWRERGPNNIGGRTRAIMVDESDPNRNRVWTGGVSGGLWRSEDISQEDPQWTKLGLLFESISIADIAQDPNDHNTIYVGTGESYTGVVPGVGMFKSVDDGETWELMPTTANATFRDINEIYVHTNSDLYVATNVGGLMKSTDGGNTWLKVLGTTLSGASNNEFHDILFIEANQTFYASNDNSVFKSTTGDRGGWFNIGTGKPGFPTDLNRVELAVCPSNPDVMYVLGAVGNSSSNTYVSNTGGETWTSRPAPGFSPEEDFTNGQAWYDLEIEVDPLNCGRIFAGGVTMFVSTFQGTSWSQMNSDNVLGGTEFHPDHHGVFFDTKKPGRAYFTNDGGIWMSNNSGGLLINKNLGYITTQFYCAAIHPEESSPYIIGGTQDNRSLQMVEPGVSQGRIVWQGDGMFCFIDQNDPDIQIVSSQGGNYGLSTNGGIDFEFGTSVNGEFVNRSGYDDQANILYGQINTGGFFRWKIGGVTEEVDVAGQNLNVSAVKADPFVPNRIYFGGSAGRVVRVDNAHEGTLIPTFDAKLIADFPGNASVSSVYMDKQTPDDMLVSLFNYGSNLENIYVTYNAGDDWTSIEGDLPDIPVRWAIFDPSDHDKVMIATDAGVWTTDNVDGEFTHWDPSTPSNGMPFVRVDMLLVRESDKVVLGATHGRGLMTTDVFSAPAAVITIKPVAYEDQSIIIDGSQSVNAQSFEWDLGDNSTSQQEKISHTYANPGTYIISLTINGVITKTRTITVLPYLPAPYEPGGNDYSGDFETHPEHFAAFTAQGTSFERGVSSKPAKDGTHSGSSAWVLGINDNVYQNNTRAEFYTPQYDLTEPGLYELKFWSKYATQNRNDGFQLEYSIDNGDSWQQLGTKEAGWYNYYNVNIEDGAFQIGKSYFTNAQLNWTQYVKDISFLGGQSHVSFRYLFKSDGSEQAQGLVLDDFEVTKFEGELKTTLTTFEASYTGEQELTLNWTTGIEFNADKFILERSFTGFEFEEIAQVNAKGGITTVSQLYEWIDQNLRNVIYYRLNVINDNPDQNFYSDVIVVRRDVDPNIVHHVLTNPFRDRIYISFSSVIDQEVSLRLFDIAGRLVREAKETPNSVGMEFDQLSFPPGIYILSIQVADEEPSTYKLFTEGR